MDCRIWSQAIAFGGAYRCTVFRAHLWQKKHAILKRSSTILTVTYIIHIYNIVGTNHHTLYRPEQQGWMYYAEPNWVDTSKIQVSEAIIKHPYFDCLYMLFTIHFMKKKGCCTIVLRTLYPLFEWSINWPLIIDHSRLYSNHWWTIKLTIESLSTILRLQNLQDGAPQLCLLLYKPH